MSRLRTVLLVWLLACCWGGGLHLRAALDPPAGRAFAGNFHWIDDFYHYLSYAQQAEQGRLLFHNKLAEPAPARIVNLEWLAVGNLSRALGGRLLLAYVLFGLAATLALLAAAERWLARLAVPRTHRTAALLLTAFGGGLGGLVFELTDLPVSRCADLSLGLFPFLEIVGNPHFVAGTALLMWSLWFLNETPGARGQWLGILAGNALVFVRPYEVALLVVVRSAVVLGIEPPALWLRRLAPLAGLAPAVGYQLWSLYGPGQFGLFEGPAFPHRLAFVPALAPAVLLAAGEWWRRCVDAAHRRTRLQLWAWVGAVLAVVVFQPGGVALQLLVGSGVPLLLLGAAALSARPRTAIALGALLMSTSAVVETRILLQDDPNWFVPSESLAAARALSPLCRSGDRLLAPPDIGLFAIGLSSCDAFVAHPAVRDYETRRTATGAFYTEFAPPARSAFLDAERVTHLVLPGWAGPLPVAWLGPDTAFRAAATIGRPQPSLSVYARPPGPARAPGGYDSRPNE